MRVIYFNQGQLQAQILKLQKPFKTEDEQSNVHLNSFIIYCMILTASFVLQDSLATRRLWKTSPKPPPYTPKQRDFKSNNHNSDFRCSDVNSIRKALRKIRHYRNHWGSDEENKVDQMVQMLQNSKIDQIHTLIKNTCNDQRALMAIDPYDDEDILRLLGKVAVSSKRSAPWTIGKKSQHAPWIPYVPELWESRNRRGQNRRQRRDQSQAASEETAPPYADVAPDAIQNERIDTAVEWASENISPESVYKSICDSIDALDVNPEGSGKLGAIVRNFMRNAGLKPSVAEKIALAASDIVFQRLMDGLVHLRAELGIATGEHTTRLVPSISLDVYSPIHYHYDYRTGKSSYRRRTHSIRPCAPPLQCCDDCSYIMNYAESYIQLTIELHRYIWYIPDSA